MGTDSRAERRPPDGERRALRTLCRLHGVRTAYEDAFERRVEPPPESLAAVLNALGAPLPSGPADAPQALRAIQAGRTQRLLPQVSVLEPEGGQILCGCPGLVPGVAVELGIELEDGSTREWRVKPVGEGRRLLLPGSLPMGYHRVRAEQRDKFDDGTLIVAPRRAFHPPGPEDRPRWGVFLPLHALRAKDDWGAGDLSGLTRFIEWVRARGGDLVGTLPLLAAFLDEPYDPSPYGPASRLFWNELYLDLRRTPEWTDGSAAVERAATPEVQGTIERLRCAPRVEYRKLWALKKGLLAELARSWAMDGGLSTDPFQAFLEQSPHARRYAAFRATLEARGESWHQWPASWRAAGIPRSAYVEEDYVRHLYAQYRTSQQVEEAAARSGPAGERGPGGEALGAGEAGGLYLDLPLGTHGDGYDVWAHPGLFATGMSGGAPPDQFFSTGQDWGFPPPLPDAMRASGYRYLASCLAHLLRPAGALRIDHVMALHRIYWVPAGMSARDGTYVRYPADELYAVLRLESHRAGATLVGEDLGTVPHGVREAMDRNGLRRMYVVPFEVRADRPDALGTVPSGCVAGAGTHDMPPFAAYWKGADIRDRVKRGWLEEEHAVEEKRERDRVRSALRHRYGLRPDAGGHPEGAGGGEPTIPTGEAGRIHAGLLEDLGRSPAGLVLVNLEDLWEEERPQNVPGTPSDENWQGRARHPLESFDRLPEVTAPLDALNEARKGREGRPGGTRQHSPRRR